MRLSREGLLSFEVYVCGVPQLGDCVWMVSLMLRLAATVSKSSSVLSSMQYWLACRIAVYGHMCKCMVP